MSVGNRAFHSYSANGFYQLDGSDVEAVGKLNNVEKAHVPLPPLYPAHVVPMQIS
jgi:hypothetical protein